LLLLLPLALLAAPAAGPDAEDAAWVAGARERTEATIRACFAKAYPKAPEKEVVVIISWAHRSPTAKLPKLEHGAITLSEKSGGTVSMQFVTGEVSKALRNCHNDAWMSELFAYRCGTPRKLYSSAGVTLGNRGELSFVRAEVASRPTPWVLPQIDPAGLKALSDHLLGPLKKEPKTQVSGKVHLEERVDLKSGRLSGVEILNSTTKSDWVDNSVRKLLRRATLPMRPGASGRARLSITVRFGAKDSKP